MAKKIEEMMQKAFWDTDISEHPAKAFEQGYELAVNAVLEEVSRTISVSEKGRLESNLKSLIKELQGE